MAKDPNILPFDLDITKHVINIHWGGLLAVEFGEGENGGETPKPKAKESSGSGDDA